ncbi:hypothetical protein [Arcobacter venerupis]|nr:hypothetical protein [Arcobacter venerupis]
MKNRTIMFYFLEHLLLPEQPQPAFFPNVFLYRKNTANITMPYII